MPQLSHQYLFAVAGMVMAGEDMIKDQLVLTLVLVLILTPLVLWFVIVLLHIVISRLVVF